MPHIDWDANRYEEDAKFVRDLGDEVIELLDPKKDEKILDLGCGEGSLTLKISQRGAKVVGVDSSYLMVEKSRAKGIEAYVRSARELDYHERFDGVFSNAVLHWIPQADEVAYGVYRALKRGGRFVAEFGGEGNVATIIKAISQLFEEHPQWGGFENSWYFPSANEYKKVLESVGFEVVSARIIPRPVPIKSIENWLDLFGEGIMKAMSEEEKKKFKSKLTEMLKPKLYDEERGWWADYVRVRVKAVKE